MVAYSFYENDNRVMRYAEALAARGDQVDVLSLISNNNAPIETINGVTVYRIQRRTIDERRKISYLSRMLGFLARSSWFMAKSHHKQPYDLIHVHSVPDFEVFAALIPKLQGAKVILDIHDIVPEFYASKFGVSKESFAFRALKLLERWSTAFSNHVIIANHIWEKVLTARSVNPEKCSTYLNYPDSRLFNTALRTRVSDGRIIMMYPGTLNWHQGLDIAVKAFDLIKDQVPEAEFDIYGGGSRREQLARLIKERALQERVKLMDIRPINEIAGVMANADIGIVPKRNDSFGGDAFSTKIFEFMALGVPIIAANTRIDRFYFNDSLVKFFQAGDERSLANAMLVMIRNHSLRKEFAKNALAYIAQQSWDIKRQDYLNLVDQLVKGNS
jgi:glycosyltransferase involved in cell wall biosynthesis